MEPLVRLGRREDEAAAAAIAQAAYAHYCVRMDRKPFPMLDDYGARIVQAQLFVLEHRGSIRAYMVLVEMPGALQLDNVGVEPASQKRGYGGRLLRYAEDEAARRGLATITLYTNEAMRENIPWYLSHGYQIIRRAEENGYRRVYFQKILRPFQSMGDPD